MALLSMTSDWIFIRMNLNAYSNSLHLSFVSKLTAILLSFEYVNYFFIDKSRAAYL